MSMEIILNQAINLYAQGRLNEAEALFRQIYDDDMTNGDALYFLGLIALSKGVSDEAVDLLYKAVRLYPKNEDYRYSYAVALQERGFLDQAIDAYGEISHLAQAQNNLGNICLAKGELDKASEHFEKAIELDKDSPWPHLNKGLLERKKGHPNEALSCFKKALQLDKNNVETLYQTGIQYRLMNDLSKALEYLNNALKIKNDSDLIWNEYGITLEQKNENEKALAAYEKALAINPYFYHALFNKAVVLEKMDRNDEAEKNYRDAIRANHNFEAAYNNLGALLYKLGRVQEALESYRQVFIINPKNAQSCFNLAVVLEDTEDYQEAAGLCFNILSLDPSMTAAHVRLATILPKWSYSNKKEALNYAKAWQKHFPDNPLARQTLNALSGKINEEDLFTYTQNFYDAFAETYDQKMNELECKVPDLIRQKLSDFSFKNALEIGCGTGLCGKILSNVCNKLTGIDFSEKMIEKAKQTKAYSTLKTIDALDFLLQTKETFDLIVAADVFCYIGEMNGLFSQVGKHLRKDGLFVFTIEKSDKENGFEINPFGRILHSRNYIKKLIDNNKLEIKDEEELEIRKEGSSHAKGIVFVCQKSKS